MSPEWYEEGYEPKLQADKKGRGHVWIESCQCPVCLYCLMCACRVGEDAKCKSFLGRAMADFQARQKKD